MGVFPDSETYLTHDRFIKFASPTPGQLDQLTTACSQVTFGRGNQDVYDESYRKALKMDTKDFTAQFDPTLSSLIKIFEGNFLQGQAENTVLSRP